MPASRTSLLSVSASNRLGLIALCALGLSLSACGGWMGDKEDAPLPGERVSVLAYDQALAADPALAQAPYNLPTPVQNTEWPTAGGRPDHAGGSYTLASATPRAAWSTSVGASVSEDQPLIPVPVVGSVAAYTLDSGSILSAHTLDKGKTLWERDLAPKGTHDTVSSGGVVLAGDKLFAATGYGELLSIDATTGDIVWRTKVDVPVRSAPVVADGRLFAVGIDNRLVALDISTGALLWTHNGISEAAGLLGAPSPAVGTDGIVLVAYSSGELYALRGANGAELWSDNLAARRSEGGILSIAAIRGQPVLAANGTIALAISNSGRFVAIDVRTGQRLWEQRLGSSQMPWVAGDTIYTISNQAQLVALNLKDGAIRWVQTLPQWRYPDDKIGLISWYGPVLAGGKLWLTNSDARLKSFDPLSGKEVDNLRLSSATNRPPIVAADTLWTLDDGARLSAWR